ncbi:hypothetical protein EVAR_30065_1 [Eumeta japonica]|uniref:Uncharacterized protein n=1 Tax=Eumeta variegata TaxID=151549 RepID=A0A4C1X7M0_EUMVA|nr:hypothetical protein EVAR_30065_1 [Eumeta japonica]
MPHDESSVVLSVPRRPPVAIHSPRPTREGRARASRWRRRPYGDEITQRYRFELSLNGATRRGRSRAVADSHWARGDGLHTTLEEILTLVHYDETIQADVCCELLYSYILKINNGESAAERRRVKAQAQEAKPARAREARATMSAPEPHVLEALRGRTEGAAAWPGPRALNIYLASAYNGIVYYC